MKVSQLTYVVPNTVKIKILKHIAGLNYGTEYFGDAKRLPKDSSLNTRRVIKIHPVDVETLNIYIE